jgi:hypothetical protein
MSDELAAARAALDAGDEQTAFGAVRMQLGWPRGKEQRDLAGWLGVLATLAERRGAQELSQLAAAAAQDPAGPDKLYTLGYALIDAEAPGLAASVLWHCLALVGDSEEVVCELVAALESALAYGDAFTILDQHEALRARAFLPQYLYGFNAAMAGKLDVTRRVVPLLAPDSRETEAMRGNLERILERADRMAGVATLDDRDLRGWHYVLTGGLLSHLSPFGFDDPMRGRYAWLQDSLARVALGIERVLPLARGCPCVFAPEGRSNAILGHTLAQRLGVPLAPWPAVGVPAPGLIAIYDLTELPAGDISRLAQRRADQVLYAHASPWTRDFPITPDVTTLLAQIVVAPWGETAVIDPETQQMSRQPADDRAVEEVAAAILASEPLSAEDVAADDPARWAGLVERAWPLPAGSRARLWAGGPVPSNRFE